ncbi:ABC transporter permease [Massilia sp. SR12]
MSDPAPTTSAALAAAIYLGQAAARPPEAQNGNWPRARFAASIAARAESSGAQRATPKPATTTPARTRIPAWLLGLLLPAALLAAAEAAVRSGLLAPNLLPPPSAILETIAELAQRGLASHVAASALRVAIGFAAGALAAILLGAATALHRPTHALLDPTVQALRAIPSLAWVPLLLLWLGIDEAPKLVLIAIGAFFPVYMGVASGIRGVDRKLVEVARLYRLPPIAQARQVLLPAALPAILTGLRNGLGLAWMFMVAAELIAASKGLGYLLSDGRETSRADIVLAAILLLAVLGKASDSLMLHLEQRLLAWRDSFESPRHA